MKSPSLRFYLLMSFIFHILVAGVFYLFENMTPSMKAPETVSINFLTPEEIAQMNKVEEAAKKVFVPNNQIVEQNDVAATEEAPENSRFLSEKNQKVQKQTVARDRGEFQNLKKSAPKPGLQGDGKEKSTSEDPKKQIARDLLKGFDPGEALERQKLADKQSGMGEGQGSGGDTSRTNDYIKDVEVGLETVLNTREFKYYSYYNRIRKQLAQHWEGRVREKLSKLFKEGRAPAATNKDRITKVIVVLNDRGTLVRVQVLSDSGVRDLDDAAIEAFRAAAPFPNPPKGIVESDGTVKIRWDFVLEV
ncbi:MAG: TonB family protein [Bdellovibrio sp.]